MAHQILPSHRPHEQLRTEAATQKSHTDKYVSCFSSGEAAVDLTFTNPILQKSADHFKVGIDDLTVNLGNLSMLEYGVGDVIFRVLRRGGVSGPGGEQDPTFLMHDGPAGDLEKYRDGFQFAVDRVYTTLQEVLGRVAEVADAVGTFIRGGLFNPPGFAPFWEFPIAAQNFQHCTFGVTRNGQISFSGNSVFWANFVIEVPLAKYRHILFKSTAHDRNISLHPVTGAVHNPYDHFLANLVTNAFVPAFNGQFGDETLFSSYVGSGNLLNTLDRRVTLEVGCSLPIKNSPLIDHGVEAPDFVLGRYMFHKPYEMDSQGIITSISLGVQTLQGSRDRVTFHHLQPQQKVTTLRLKLWARVRTFNEVSGKWGMQTIVCPVEDNDYWHVRLHFVEK